MTHRALAGTARASLDYLRRRSIPARLTALGLPVLVIFGTDDQRWRSSSAAYRSVPGARVELLPGVGHTLMPEDPQTTGKLLLDFVAAAGNGSHPAPLVSRSGGSMPGGPGG
jgi:pimeloyl-ACP methyl ester carboxylesterase